MQGKTEPCPKTSLSTGTMAPWGVLKPAATMPATKPAAKESARSQRKKKGKPVFGKATAYSYEQGAERDQMAKNNDDDLDPLSKTFFDPHFSLRSLLRLLVRRSLMPLALLCHTALHASLRVLAVRRSGDSALGELYRLERK